MTNHEEEDLTNMAVGYSLELMKELEKLGLKKQLQVCVKYYIEKTKWKTHLTFDQARTIIEFAEKEIEKHKIEKNNELPTAAQRTLWEKYCR